MESTPGTAVRKMRKLRNVSSIMEFPDREMAGKFLEANAYWLGGEKHEIRERGLNYVILTNGYILTMKFKTRKPKKEE